MPATTTEPPDPLTMTDAEVDALAADARQAADEAARALADALEVPSSVSPARLAELRAVAEHSALLVPDAEQRQATVREARRQARREEIKAQIRAEAAADLDGAEQLIAAYDAYEAATRGLCEAVQAHNARITKWGRQMAAAGIRPIHGEGRAPDALTHMVGGENVTIGHKVYRRMRAGTLLAAVLHRVLAAYPREMRKYNVDQELAHDGDLTDSNGRVNVRALIQRDA
ncbi:hypothetical protein [Streptomyces sp. NPDC058678]|uniref:hypothetical protein n=1 Tax=Streptomyces sp. NPDC058678 TaxID=3346595 RepID=UPI00365BFC8C